MADAPFDPANAEPYEVPPPAAADTTPGPGGVADTPFDPTKGEEYSPPYGQWPGVVGRTFVQSMAPLGYTDLANELQREGKPAPTYQEYMKSIPQEPRYGGALGYLQEGAAMLGGPISGPLFAVAPGASIAGGMAHEAARQAGAPSWVQTGASLVGGGVGGAIVDAGTSLAGRGMEAVVANRVASGADNVAASLRTDAGVADPSVLGTTLKHETGKVIQDDVGNTDAVMGAGDVKATAKTMKTRAAKATGTDLPPMTAGDKFLNDIDQAPDPSAAVDTALGNPAYWKSLPIKAKSALASHVAGQAGTRPEVWLGLSQIAKNELIPDVTQRMAVEATARQAMSRLPIRPVNPTPAADSPAWQNALNWAGNMLAHHALGRAGLGATAGGVAAHLLHLPPSYGEAAGAVAGALRPAVRYSLTPRGATNILTGGAQGYLGGPSP